MAVKEHKEFFLRNTPLNTGEHPDMEANYPTQELVKGVKKYNRFLDDNYPSEGIFRKLFDSITFKLNKSDTASSTIQGLVKKSTDAIAEARTLNPDSDFTLAIAPHQLPEIVLSTDVNDAVQGTPTEIGGLKLSILKRTLSGLYRKNYKLEVNVDKSIEIDATTKKLQLKNDTTSPGNRFYYGTDASGTKGFFLLNPADTKIYLRTDFSKTDNTLATIGTSSPFSAALEGGGKFYAFRAYLFVDPQATGGWKVGLSAGGGLVENRLIYEIHYTDDLTTAIEKKDRHTAFGTASQLTSVGNGVIEVTGTISVATAGTLLVQFSQGVSNASPSTIKAGSYFIVEELR